MRDRVDFLLRLLMDEELWFFWELLTDPLLGELLDDQEEAEELAIQVH